MFPESSLTSWIVFFFFLSDKQLKQSSSVLSSYKTEKQKILTWQKLKPKAVINNADEF